MKHTLGLCKYSICQNMNIEMQVIISSRIFEQLILFQLAADSPKP